MLDVRKLRMLAALQRLGTIAAVADELSLTAPGVSMQLAALEREVGLQLTERLGRRVVLTPAGAVLAAHGREIVDRISLAEAELGPLRAGTAGRYTVTAFPSGARTLLADACASICGDPASALDLRVTTAEPEAALAALSTGEADLAVLHSYSNVRRDMPPGITSRVIGAEPVWLAVRGGDPIPAGAVVRLEDYAGHPWIVPTDDVTCFVMVERACGLAGFRPRIVAESMDFGVQLALVAAGAGVALVPDLTVDRVSEGVELVGLAAPIERTIYLAARAPRFADPGIERLASLIEESARRWLGAGRERVSPTRTTN